MYTTQDKKKKEEEKKVYAKQNVQFDQETFFVGIRIIIKLIKITPSFSK